MTIDILHQVDGIVMPTTPDPVSAADTNEADLHSRFRRLLTPFDVAYVSASSTSTLNQHPIGIGSRRVGNEGLLLDIAEQLESAKLGQLPTGQPPKGGTSLRHLAGTISVRNRERR